MAFAVGHRTQAGAVEYANALQRIVSNGGAIGEVPRGRRVVGGTPSGIKPYNGYFKIIDASEYDKDSHIKVFRIKVVDGATYNPETGESDIMQHTYGAIESATLEFNKEYDKLIGLMLHIHRGGFSSEQSIEPYIKAMPRTSHFDYYAPIGRVLLSKSSNENDTKYVDSVTIVQDHISGAELPSWAEVCGEWFYDS